ncbi:hypothetical protein CFBP6600_40620 [Xanthomonas arboricola pv. corylina]|nr:hypothetical protein CFBP6600_40620 [Xanthomonas arboricola pv. corylina]CAE6850413.1 hypothetical protein CFBP6600_40620 [Xanthomonas arboricola pv. corylina]
MLDANQNYGIETPWLPGTQCDAGHVTYHARPSLAEHRGSALHAASSAVGAIPARRWRIFRKLARSLRCSCRTSVPRRNQRGKRQGRWTHWRSF